MDNLILMTDSYKLTHWQQYPPGTQYVSSYIEARGVEAGRDWKECVFFGLHPFLEMISKPITREMLNEAVDFANKHGQPINKEGWEYILRVHNGLLPVDIQALPEGSVVPIGTPLVQITNTDPKCFWLTSYLETAMLRAVWYPTTVATQSFHIKRQLKNFLESQGSSIAGLDFMLHDFGARGVSSGESAGIGGGAHLTCFQGSDTLEGIMWLNKYYRPDTFPGFSVPAAEHSTITTWGAGQGETDAYRNMLRTYAKPNAIISVVSDSYNIFLACEHIWGDLLKEEVKALGKIGARLVIRPDSGDPATTCVEIAHILYNQFKEDCTKTDKGFIVLPPYLRILQGDGINEKSIKQILNGLAEAGFAAENMVFGMGGALLQGINRDTLKFAQKANAIDKGNGWEDVFKSPVGGGKTSRRGRQAVYCVSIDTQNSDTLEWTSDTQWITTREDSQTSYPNMLIDRFTWGRMAAIPPRLELIRKRINNAL